MCTARKGTKSVFSVESFASDAFRVQHWCGTAAELGTGKRGLNNFTFDLCAGLYV